jgi:hypothetical protein
MLSRTIQQVKNAFYQDLSNFLQNTSFAHQFRFLAHATSSKDVVKIIIDPFYDYSIFRISQQIFSVTRISHYGKDKIKIESALIECYYDTFSVIDVSIKTRKNIK